MGGNVFPDTSNIIKENIPITLKEYFEELFRLFPKNIFSWDSHFIWYNNWTMLGSTGKVKYSGDIDLGTSISKSDMGKWNISETEFNPIFEKLQSRSKTASESQLIEKAMLICIANYININSDMIVVDTKKINYGNMFTKFPQYDKYGTYDRFVQIDWMIGDLAWLEFTYYSNGTDTGNIKGLHRTQLLVALCTLAGLSFSHSQGVKDLKNPDIILNTPIKLRKELNSRLSLDLYMDNFFSFTELYSYLAKSLSPDMLDKLIGIYLKILDSTRCDIPIILQKKWKIKKSELNLTGKFLPKDSNLYQGEI